MQEKRRSLKELLQSLPAYDAAKVEAAYQEALQADDTKVIALDDDPTSALWAVWLYYRIYAAYGYYPGIICAGGFGPLSRIVNGNRSEAEVLRRVCLNLGVTRERLILAPLGTNTGANVQAVRKMLLPGQNVIWSVTKRQSLRTERTVAKQAPELMSYYFVIEETLDEAAKLMNGKILCQKLFRDAITTGHDYIINYKRTGKKAPLALKAKFEFYDKTLFALVKKVVGIQNGRFFPVAGAPLSDTVLEFLLSLNIPIRYGYGLSETTATVCFFPEENYTIGSIGIIQPNLEVKIDPNNQEILVRGKTVMSGYYKRPEENAISFTADGFFRTGDAGRLDGDTLYFLERIKDLYKTSNGKYIAPQAIELSITRDPYIEQVAVIGDQRKFVSALVVPNYELLEQYAKSKNLVFASREEMLGHELIHKLIQAHIEEHQRELASFEKIKRFTLLASPFTMESGALTDTLKLRRRVVNELYAKEIDAMYAE